MKADPDGLRPVEAGKLALLFLPLFTVSLGYGAVLRILPLLMERLQDLGWLFAVCSLVLLTRASVYGAALLVVALVALGFGVLGPTLSLAMAGESGADVGTAIGLQNAAGSLGQAAGSAAAGALFGVFANRSFGIVAALMFAAAVVVWSTARTRGGLLRPTAVALDAAMPFASQRRVPRTGGEDQE